VKYWTELGGGAAPVTLSSVASALQQADEPVVLGVLCDEELALVPEMFSPRPGHGPWLDQVSRLDDAAREAVLEAGARMSLVRGDVTVGDSGNPVLSGRLGVVHELVSCRDTVAVQLYMDEGRTVRCGTTVHRVGGAHLVHHRLGEGLHHLSVGRLSHAAVAAAGWLGEPPGSSVGRDAASALVAQISALGGVLSGTFAPQGGGVARFVADVSDVARSGQLEMVALVASLATAWLVCCACACTFCKRRRRRPTPSRGPSRRRQRMQRRIVPVVEDLEEW